jgi:SAM-dependent methyltransferase
MRPASPELITKKTVIDLLHRHEPPNGARNYWQGHACRYALSFQNLFNHYPEVWQNRGSVGLTPGSTKPLRVLCAGDKGSQTILTRWLLPEAIVTSTSLYEAGNWSIPGENGQPMTFGLESALIDEEVWPFAEASFDIIMIWEVVEHLYHDPLFAFLEARRVLVPDGVLQITTPNANNCQSLGRLLSGEQPTLFPAINGWGVAHPHELSLGYLRRLTDSSGFTVIEHTTVQDNNNICNTSLDDPECNRLPPAVLEALVLAHLVVYRSASANFFLHEPRSN